MNISEILFVGPLVGGIIAMSETNERRSSETCSFRLAVR